MCDSGSATGGTTLGRAIAVSGAAASPNMGYHTSPVVAFLLTVFNLRLGWWFPHPGTQAGSAASPRFNLGYMFAELFASATYRSRFLMISDGGHFENLAVYELIKRRCAVIIVSDAECDRQAGVRRPRHPDPHVRGRPRRRHRHRRQVAAAAPRRAVERAAGGRRDDPTIRTAPRGR